MADSPRSTTLKKLADMMPQPPTEQEVEDEKQKAAAAAKAKGRRALEGAKPSKDPVTVPVASLEF